MKSMRYARSPVLHRFSGACTGNSAVRCTRVPFHLYYTGTDTWPVNSLNEFYFAVQSWSQIRIIPPISCFYAIFFKSCIRYQEGNPNLASLLCAKLAKLATAKGGVVKGKKHVSLNSTKENILPKWETCTSLFDFSDIVHVLLPFLYCCFRLHLIVIPVFLQCVFCSVTFRCGVYVFLASHSINVW